MMKYWKSFKMAPGEGGRRGLKLQIFWTRYGVCLSLIVTSAKHTCHQSRFSFRGMVTVPSLFYERFALVKEHFWVIDVITGPIHAHKTLCTNEFMIKRWSQDSFTWRWAYWFSRHGHSIIGMLQNPLCRVFIVHAMLQSPFVLHTWSFSIIANFRSTITNGAFT